MIYFDNAATSFPKPKEVMRELTECVNSYLGNPGRSSHKLSLTAADKIYSVREKIANHLGVSTPEQIVFTYNATHALNLAIKSFATKDCHVLTSDFEHNSVIRPLERLRQTHNISYSTFGCDGDITKNLDGIISPSTSGIICSIASNVIGDEIPLKVLSDYAKQRDLFLIIDASQAIGHKKIDLGSSPCDVLCAPGHKALFGIQGCGFAYFNSPVRKEGIIEGGSGSESINLQMPRYLPEGYEAGTPATPAIVTLGSGLDYINKIGIDEIERRLNFLTDEMRARLESIRSITLYKSGIGIVSFNISDISSSKIALALDHKNICVRGGLHCAPSVHKRLGTLTQGAVRISFSYLNKLKELDVFYNAIKDIANEI